ncbi:MAG: hypothetical protein PHH98_03165 [Candidatus Gracilibacteria bacterium]|nr:hypothetical protein [Candidatus Gracilibacteria bacterium]
MKNINIEINEKYREYLDLLKQVIPNADGSEIKDDSRMIEVLIDSFISFIQEQGEEHDHEHGEDGGHCGSGCGCSH